jgi:hypothetical protein
MCNREILPWNYRFLRKKGKAFIVIQFQWRNASVRLSEHQVFCRSIVWGPLIHRVSYDPSLEYYGFALIHMQCSEDTILLRHHSTTDFEI